MIDELTNLCEKIDKPCFVLLYCNNQITCGLNEKMKKMNSKDKVEVIGSINVLSSGVIL